MKLLITSLLAVLALIACSDESKQFSPIDKLVRELNHAPNELALESGSTFIQIAESVKPEDLIKIWLKTNNTSSRGEVADFDVLELRKVTIRNQKYFAAQCGTNEGGLFRSDFINRAVQYR